MKDNDIFEHGIIDNNCEIIEICAKENECNNIYGTEVHSCPFKLINYKKDMLKVKIEYFNDKCRYLDTAIGWIQKEIKRGRDAEIEKCKSWKYRMIKRFKNVKYCIKLKIKYLIRVLDKHIYYPLDVVLWTKFNCGDTVSIINPKNKIFLEYELQSEYKIIGINKYQLRMYLLKHLSEERTCMPIKFVDRNYKLIKK